MQIPCWFKFRIYQYLVGLGFPAENIVYDSPVKTPKELKAAIGRNMPLTGWPVIHGRVFMVLFKNVTCTLYASVYFKQGTRTTRLCLLGWVVRILLLKCTNSYLTWRIYGLTFSVHQWNVCKFKQKKREIALSLKLYCIWLVSGKIISRISGQFSIWCNY